MAFICRYMNIFLISAPTEKNVLANKILASHHCNNLLVQSSHAAASTTGTTVSININSFEEVEAFCIAHQINAVIINQIECLQQGLFNFLQDEKRQWKGIVVGCSNAFFNEPFAATSIEKSIATLVSDGKKYFNITKNSLGENELYVQRLMQCVSENNYSFNGFIEVYISNENSIKYYPCLFNEDALQHLETDIVSIFAAAYNGTFEDVNIEIDN